MDRYGSLQNPFTGPEGIERLSTELTSHRLVGGNSELARKLADKGKVIITKRGDTIIEEGQSRDEVYFILSGELRVEAQGKTVAVRRCGEAVGELTWISPMQRRSATVISEVESVILEITAEAMEEAGDLYPKIYKQLAGECAKRLLQRNHLMRKPNERPRVFVISSSEAISVARLIENAFAHDPFVTVVWANGVFRVTSYTLETLERELELADFAIAIAHPDDRTEVRNEQWPTPRDNVVFELGFFMGALGRDRAILMEPRDATVKLPSDLAGVTTIPYRYDSGPDAAAVFSPASNQVRDHIKKLGVRI